VVVEREAKVLCREIVYVKAQSPEEANDIVENKLMAGDISPDPVLDTLEYDRDNAAVIASLKEIE
jgi:hypothetical protein